MEGKLQSPLRPKADPQQKPDAVLEESGDDGQDGKKGNPIFSSREKGKGKMAEREEVGSDIYEHGYSDDTTDGDCTDDPLTDMDVENIIPGRIRPRMVVQPGTYRLEGESDEDDHTTDGEGTEEEDEDEEDEEAEEEEEEEEVEDEEEGNEEEAENSEGSE